MKAVKAVKEVSLFRCCVGGGSSRHLRRAPHHEIACPFENKPCRCLSLAGRTSKDQPRSSAAAVTDGKRKRRLAAEIWSVSKEVNKKF